METKIRSVQKGMGEDSIFYTTNQDVAPPHRVDEIKEEFKEVDNNGGGFKVYRGYTKGELIFEMGITSDILVIYGEKIGGVEYANSDYK